MARRRGGRALGPGLSHLLEQLVTPSGHIRSHPGPITPDFEPVLPDNRYTRHVRPSAATRASWYQNFAPAPLLDDGGDQRIVPVIQSLQSSQIPAASIWRTITPQQVYRHALEDPYHTQLHPETFTGYYSDPAQAAHAEHYVERARQRALGEQDNLGEPEDITNLALLIGGGAGIKAFKTAAEAAAGLAEAAGGAGEATSAAGQVAEAGRAVKALQAAGRVATAPIRHPFLTSSAPVAAEVPGAVSSGNPGALLHGFTGAGVAAAALGSVSKRAQEALPGVLGAAAGDAISLPAQVLPSLYLPLAAGVEAAEGDPQHLHELQQGFQDESAIGQLLYHHSLQGAGEAALRHPLYATLEALGVKSGIGHGITYLGRALGREDAAAGRMRPNLNIMGDQELQQGPYSPDYFRRRRQERADSTYRDYHHGGGRVPRERVRNPWDKGENDPGAFAATPAERRDYFQRDVADRMEYANQGVRKLEQRRIKHELDGVKPGRAMAKVASLRAQGFISRDYGTALLDLGQLREQALHAQRDGHLHPDELAQNKQLVKGITAALKDGDLSQLSDFTAKLREITHAQEPELASFGVLTEEQAQKRIAQVYAAEHMGARRGLANEDLRALADLNENDATNIGARSQIESRAQFLDESGNPLSTEAIHEHMRDPESGPGFVDPEELSYVTHKRPRPNDESTAHYAGNNVEPPGAGSRKPFTGGAVAKGTFDPSYDAAVRQAIRNQTIIDRFKGFTRIFDKVGIRAPDGSYFPTHDVAQHVIDSPDRFGVSLPEVAGGYEAVNLVSFGTPKAVREAFGDVGQNRADLLDFKDEPLLEELAGKALEDATRGGNGQYVIVPKALMKRLREHNAQLLTGEKVGQAITGAFKGAVLPTSLSWFTGNVIDNWIIRGFGTGITLGDIRAGKALRKIVEEELTPEEAAYAMESILPGAQAGSYSRVQPYRSAAQFEGTRIAPLAQGIHNMLEAPGIKTVADGYRLYRDAVFELDSKFVEQTPQYGQLAKTARKELGYTRRKFRKAIADGDPAIRDLARGLRNTDAVNRYARSIEDVFGNWGKNSAAQRRFLTTWAPFWMWARAAGKFVFVTLPRDHPVLTGIAAAAGSMTREERQKLGFDFFADEPLPSWAQGSIPDPLGGEGGIAKLTNLTSFGVFADPTGFATQLLVPQFSKGMLAGAGLDWKGDKLVKADGTPADPLEKIKAAIFGFGEAYVPFLNTARSISGKGPAGLIPVKTYPADTVKGLREPRQEISVPVESSSSSGSSSNPWDAGGGESSSGNPWDAGSTSSSSSGNPWDR